MVGSYTAYTQSAATTIALDSGGYLGGETAIITWIADGHTITPGSRIKWIDGTTTARAYNSGNQIVILLKFDVALGYAYAFVFDTGEALNGGALNPASIKITC